MLTACQQKALRQLIYAAPCVVFIAWVYHMTGSVYATAFINIPTLVLLALIAAPALTECSASGLQWLVLPGQHAEHAAPQYSRGEAKLAKGLGEAALAEFETIALSHPADMGVYVRMLQVLSKQLRDPERMHDVMDRALENVADEKDRQQLGRIYFAEYSRLEGREGWEPFEEARVRNLIVSEPVGVGR